MPLKEISNAINRNVGSPLRAALDRLLQGLGFGPCPRDRTSAHKMAFTVAVVALSAKMAKSDGIVSQIERDAFRQIFKTSPGEAKNVERIFDVAQQDVAGFEAYAKQMADLLVSEEFRKVKKCSDPACGWLFLDISRNRSRRWCDMADCGNRAKASRFYKKKKKKAKLRIVIQV